VWIALSISLVEGGSSAFSICFCQYRSMYFVIGGRKSLIPDLLLMNFELLFQFFLSAFDFSFSRPGDAASLSVLS